MAASQPLAAELAGRIGDALVTVAPDEVIAERFEASGGVGKPKPGQAHVCWAKTEKEARRTAYEIWPNGGLQGALSQELPLPEHFEQAAKMVTEEDVAESVVCGPDPERHKEQIREFEAAGYDHVYVHQVGPDQQGFLNFYAREILPEFQ